MDTKKVVELQVEPTSEGLKIPFEKDSGEKNFEILHLPNGEFYLDNLDAQGIVSEDFRDIPIAEVEGIPEESAILAKYFVENKEVLKDSVPASPNYRSHSDYQRYLSIIKNRQARKEKLTLTAQKLYCEGGVFPTIEDAPELCRVFTDENGDERICFIWGIRPIRHGGVAPVYSAPPSAVLGCLILILIIAAAGALLVFAVRKYPEWAGKSVPDKSSPVVEEITGTEFKSLESEKNSSGNEGSLTEDKAENSTRTEDSNVGNSTKTVSIPAGTTLVGTQNDSSTGTQDSGSSNIQPSEAQENVSTETRASKARNGDSLDAESSEVQSSGSEKSQAMETQNSDSSEAQNSDSSKIQSSEMQNDSSLETLNSEKSSSSNDSKTSGKSEKSEEKKNWWEFWKSNKNEESQSEKTSSQDESSKSNSESSESSSSNNETKNESSESNSENQENSNKNESANTSESSAENATANSSAQEREKFSIDLKSSAGTEKFTVENLDSEDKPCVIRGESSNGEILWTKCFVNDEEIFSGDGANVEIPCEKLRSLGNTKFKIRYGGKRKSGAEFQDEVEGEISLTKTE